jgi:hemerythrin-like domain-containing protein
MTQEKAANPNGFAIVHKGVRLAVATCVTQSFRCDVKKKSQVKSLARDFRLMIEFLRGHAKNEDEHVFNLPKLMESSAGPVVKRLATQHEEFYDMEERMLNLSQELKKNPNVETLSKLQQEVKEYQDIMLVHLNTEETQVMNMITEVYTPDEVSKIYDDIEQHLDFRERLLGARYVFPATTTKQKLQLMGKFNTSKAEETVFGTVVVPWMVLFSMVTIPLTMPKRDKIYAHEKPGEQEPNHQGVVSIA